MPALLVGRAGRSHVAAEAEQHARAAYLIGPIFLHAPLHRCRLLLQTERAAHTARHALQAAYPAFLTLKAAPLAGRASNAWGAPRVSHAGRFTRKQCCGQKLSSGLPPCAKQASGPSPSSQ